ncbi:helix-turn-helix domain-containing protein [Candidatus Mycobacterium methanotrophicum]|uniref:Helix-turn-helix domain-containing protein n=1 Tax=Candidatus Mycobacterium methanotrophicum TaxID=2943498 RepID=A0ABY4QNF8_9MYCO|nr:helix-turn-helix domain-containing protein [Candidatus Mycobacterium methanotrophicum]UQX11319.1 helix-turn-helix domain-containing protein [Candidatus Mycobacterium methanotrophicum]
MFHFATVERMDDLPDKRTGGMSIRAIATALRVSPNTILKGLRESPGYAPDENGRIAVRRVQGIDGKIRPSRRFDTTARDDAIRSMRETGSTIRAIAAELNCSIGTVHRVLSKSQQTIQTR